MNNKTEVEQVIGDIGTVDDFIKAVDSTIKNFDDGDLVEGTVVKIDHDEVLISAAALSLQKNPPSKKIAPEDVVEVGDTKPKIRRTPYPFQ